MKNFRITSMALPWNNVKRISRVSASGAPAIIASRGSGGFRKFLSITPLKTCRYWTRPARL
jgi:hypothetical protein